MKFKESPREIERRMLEALAGDINKHIRQNVKIFERTIRQVIPDWIREQPEIQSLLTHGVPNSLAAQFGIEPGKAEPAVGKIIAVILNGIEINVLDVNSKLEGGVEFSINPNIIRDLTGTREGIVYTDKGTELDWLDWLLNLGDTTIITNYHYTPSADGRSGGGTMSRGDVWRVPPQFAGTEDNNFITRAFENRESDISNLLGQIFR